MKNIAVFMLSILLSANLTGLLSSENAQTIAILDFSNNSLVDKEKHASLSQGLTEIMITELSKIQSLKLVERQKINVLIQEMQLSQSGIISEAAGLQVGKLLGAHFLVFGSYMISFNDQIRVDIRIVEVETGVTVKAEEVTDKLPRLFDIIKKLNEKIIKDLSIRLSSEEQKAVMNSATSLEAIAQFSTGLELEEANKIAAAKKIYEKILVKNPDFEPARKRLRELSERN